MSLVGQYDMPLFTSIFSSLYVPVPGLQLPDSTAIVVSLLPAASITALLLSIIYAVRHLIHAHGMIEGRPWIDRRHRPSPLNW